MKRYFLFLPVLILLLAGCTYVLPSGTTAGNTSSSTTETTTETTESKPITGWVTEGSKTFYLNEDGTRHIGWLQLGNTRYYFDTDGALHIGWLEQDNTRYYFSKDGVLQTGWLELDNARYYLDKFGILQTGWLELDGTKYYLGTDGAVQTGWLKLDGKTYYLKSNGAITQGEAVIDDLTYHFTSTGERIILANPWNFIPADYTPQLKAVERGWSVDVSCWDSLVKMMADCKAAGHGIKLVSGYRNHSVQITLYNNKVKYYLNLGYDEATAKKEAATVVAVPGTSEHELGLAVDLADSAYTNLDEKQEKTDTQKWLMEHCWEYGFILRHPNSKTESTGIIYEPWHYRYVGKDVAMVLKSTGQSLEEYLDGLK